MVNTKTGAIFKILMIKIEKELIIKCGNQSVYFKNILLFNEFISDIWNNHILKVKIESIIENGNHSPYLVSLFNFEL